MNDFDPTALEAELDAALTDQLPEPALSDADREAGWRIKDRKAAADEPSEADDEAALGEAYDKVTTAPDDEKNWSREMRRLADAALSANGIDPAKRHEAGISRREAVRRLFHAEQMLRENPAEGLSHLARAYVGADDGTKLAVADRVLKTLGIESQGRLAEAERQRLQHFEAQQQQLQQQAVRAHQQAVERVRAFAQGRPHFAAVRGVMSALMTSGEAATLEQAYEQATRLRGLPGAAEAAQTEAQQRREKAARADRARTPRSHSVSVPEIDTEEDPAKIMEAVYDRMMS